jgi:polar amino acid transport system substrate-binding protein
MIRRSLLVVLVISCACAFTACASSNEDATKSTISALESASRSAPTTTTPVAIPDCGTDALKSYRPVAPPPALGDMPAGSSMKRIQDKQQLLVGVDENTLQLSARDPESHQIVGFEVDLARALGAAILGKPDQVTLVTVVTEQKVPFVKQGHVDLTVSAVSMTCERWQQVDFSDPYLLTDQRVLVRGDSPVRTLEDLAHRKVCVTKGSTTFEKLKDRVPGVVRVVLPARTDCLVALQDGSVDGIASHATILYGLHYQDQKNTRFVDGSFSNQAYGIAVARSDDHGFARFVNAVLERLRANGTLQGLYDKWITAMPEGTATLPSPPEYREEQP